MKIGLFGGSFNPVHYAHGELVRGVLEEKIVDEVWVIPTKEHVFGKNLTDFEDRVNMLNLVFEKDPKEVLRKAVYGMLQKNKLRSEQIKRLKFE